MVITLTFVLVILVLIGLLCLVSALSAKYPTFAPSVQTTAYLLIAIAALYWLLGPHLAGLLR